MLYIELFHLLVVFLSVSSATGTYISTRCSKEIGMGSHPTVPDFAELDDLNEISEGYDLWLLQVAVPKVTSKTVNTSSTWVLDIKNDTVTAKHANLLFTSLVFQNSISQDPTYYREVSVTLWCTMLLAFTGVLVHGLLAVSRNADELSSRREASRFTETMAAVSQCSSISPILCTLFVTTRMHVLIVTTNTGEPPLLVKSCMIVVTTGVLLQYLVVFMLSLFTQEQSHKTFRQLTTLDTLLVHPVIDSHIFNWPSIKPMLSILLWTAILGIYAGAVGILVGMFVVACPSPSMIAIVLLIVLYALTTSSVWLTFKESIKMKDLVVDEQAAVTFSWKRASYAAQMACKSAPMFAVLILAARQHAMHVLPPNGEMPIWAQASAFTGIGLLTLSVLTAALVGAKVKHGKVQVGYYGTIANVGSLGQEVVLFCLKGMIWGCVVVIIISVFTLSPSGEQPASCSPTTRCVLLFSALFFSIEGLKAVLIFVQNVLGHELPTWLDVTQACEISASIAPLPSILFIAIRMRALQITNNEGAPQVWVQEDMYVIVAGVYMQAMCSLLLPIFTGRYTGCDEDGSAKYDLQPMFGAYIVTAIKYLAVIGIYGYMIVVSASAFFITPQNANYGSDYTASFKFRHGFMILILLLATLLITSAKGIGLFVKLLVESTDGALLGVDVSMQKAVLGICEGHFQLVEIEISNPKPTSNKAGFTTPYLIKIDQALVELNIQQIIASRGKVIEIHRLAIQGVHINVEKPSMGATSNVNFVLRKFKDNCSFCKKLSPCSCKPVKEKLKDKVLERMKNTNILVHSVEMNDISASIVWSELGGQRSVELLRVEVDDILLKEPTDNKLAAVEDIVLVVVRTLLTTVMSERRVLGSLVGAMGKASCGGLKDGAVAVLDKARCQNEARIDEN